MAPQNVLILPAATASARVSSPSPAARTKLLLEGPVLPTLLRLAAPNVLNLLAFVGVITFDGFFLGRIGTDALAGASLAFPWVMLVLQTTNSGMGAGVSSAVARALGAGRRERADDLVFHAFLLAIALAAAFSTAMLLASPIIFRWMGGRARDACGRARLCERRVRRRRRHLRAQPPRQRGARHRQHEPARRGARRLRRGPYRHLAGADLRLGADPGTRPGGRRLGPRDPVRGRQPGHALVPALAALDRPAEVPRRRAALGAVRRHPEGRRARARQHRDHQPVRGSSDRDRRAVRTGSRHRLRHGGAPRIHHAAGRLRLRHRDRRHGRDELGRRAARAGAADRLDGSDHDRCGLRHDRRRRRALAEPLDGPLQRRPGGRPSRRAVSADRRTGLCCFGLALGLFFVSQGFGRGFGAMSANAARLLVSAGAGLAAVYWLDLGIAGFFTAIATGFVLYAALLVYVVLRVRAPERPA